MKRVAIAILAVACVTMPVWMTRTITSPMQQTCGTTLPGEGACGGAVAVPVAVEIA
jgi:hypothetical protein